MNRNLPTIINGTAGDDILEGTPGIDKIVGFAGNDILLGNEGHDFLFGNGGDDTLYGGEGHDFLLGGIGEDSLYGDDGSDNLDGGKGNDRLYGGAGSDILVGGDGNDALFGGTGADYFDGGEGIDTVYFNENFAITADLSQGRATYINDAGVEVVETLINIERLVGTAFDDILIGDQGNNWLQGNAGVDYFDGGEGIDTVNFNENFAITADLSQGRATYINDAGVEVVETLINIERLFGTDFDDTLIGDQGNNWLHGNAGADYFDGGEGIDTVNFNENFAITADLSQGYATYINDAGVEVVETLINIERLVGTAFDDTLIGDQGHNVLWGNAGNDVLDGRGGIDTASFFGLQAGVTVNLNQETATLVNQAGELEVDTLVNIENLTGTNFDDQLTGDAGNNTLRGLDGDDLLTGGAGADIFSFGSSNPGAGEFAFRSSNPGIDTITDFNSTQGDKIRVFAKDFSSGLTIGTLDIDQFTIGSAATRASDRFIYNDTTGALFFDSDGTGVLAQVQLAQLSGGVALSNNDIFVA
ncbi:MAG: hypothetical protein F6K41_18925 [Symploca sp. SIO3E6]|nr:hypothetical protein [Caldora sp. SIO3E6]